MPKHDWIKYPELTNSQMKHLQYESPHPQIEDDFDAKVIRVVDGDTIILRTSFRDFEFPLRILDINAPEMNEGGGEAKRWLKKRIENQEVKIIIEPKQRVGKYGRLLGRILHSGSDIGNEMESLHLVTAFDAHDEGEIPHTSYWTDQGEIKSA